jgi:hypothetical protein
MHETQLTEIKKCNKCNRFLPLTNFGKNSGAKHYRSECRACANDRSKVSSALRKVTPPPAMDHVCPICNKTEPEVRGKGGKNSGSWVLDHDHSEKTFRGWLCHQCNRAIGNFNDNPTRLLNAIAYITKSMKTS